jgi:Reverse transcriptase (RNA-dependent DNA polymerase)
VNQEWLIRFVEHRIGDRRIIRLIRKWLQAGVMENGVVTVSEQGTGQGAVISPLLANIYLHYVLDLWAVRWRQREATGEMTIVRYADDFIVGFLVPRQLFGYGRSDRSPKLIRGLGSEAAAGFRSRRRRYREPTPVIPHYAPFPSYKAARVHHAARRRRSHVS